MSQENVELTRRAFEAFKDRDLDGLLAMMADDVEAFPILAGMEGGYRGHDGIRRWWTGLLGTFPDFSAEVVELRGLGDSTLAVAAYTGSRGRERHARRRLNLAGESVSARPVHRVARVHQ